MDLCHQAVASLVRQKRWSDAVLSWCTVRVSIMPNNAQEMRESHAVYLAQPKRLAISLSPTMTVSLPPESSRVYGHRYRGGGGAPSLVLYTTVAVMCCPRHFVIALAPLGWCEGVITRQVHPQSYTISVSTTTFAVCCTLMGACKQ